MNEIIESIINGQRKQAIEQLKESPFRMADLMEELQDAEMQDEIIKIYRVALHTGYIIEGE